LIEIRLALEQFYNGLEAQKKYLRELKKAYPGGLPSYIAHFASIRNEVRSTIRLFRDDAIRRIDSTKLFEQAKIYLRYKVADKFSTTDADISAIIRTEQGQSIIDVYETAVDIFQRLIKSGRVGRHKSAIARAIEAWSGIDDFRLAKLAVALGLQRSNQLNFADVGAQAAFARGDIRAAYIAARKRQRSSPSDVWAGIEREFAAGLLRRERPHFGASPWSNLGRQLSIVLARAEEFEEASGELEKFCRNFGGLHSAAALGDFSAFVVASEVNPQSTLTTASLNLKRWGPEDLLLANGEFSPAVKDSLDQNTALFWSGTQPMDPANPAVTAAIYLSAIRASRDAQSDALRLLNRLHWRSLPPQLRGLVSNLRIALALQEGERNLAISFIAEETAASPAVRPSLPAALALADRPWDDLGAIPNKLDLAIALDVLWRQTNPSYSPLW
jgi:hypothetical protein